MKLGHGSRADRPARSHILTLLLVAGIAAAIGCSKRSGVVSPAATPAAATTLPASLPAATYRVTFTTIFGQSENGQMAYVPIERDTVVVMLRPDPVWSMVRTPEGKEGLIPTARLDPQVSFEGPSGPMAQSAAGPMRNSSVVGPTPPALPVMGMARSVTSQPLEVSPDAVREAIDRAVKYLESQRHDDHWEVVPAPVSGETSYKGARWGQLTSLATYALLSSGGNWTGTIPWLTKVPIPSTVGIGERAQVLEIVSNAKLASRPSIKFLDADAMVLWQFLNYRIPAGAAVPDEYPEAIAGLASLERAGVELRDEFWLAIEQKSAQLQNPDGSWGGPAGPAPARAAATGAGVAARVLIDDRIFPVVGPLGADCQGAITDECLRRAEDWLDGHAADAIGDPAAMWAVERAALATGRKYFGAVEWYRTGADFLLRTQRPDGSWPASPGADPVGRSIPETAYALLFLVRGNSWLMVNKLDYESAPNARSGARPFGPAQQRPLDLAHFSEWAGRTLQTGHPMGWQWVNFSMQASDLEEAPILYITGSEALDFTPPQIEALRHYILRGGLIVGNAECGSPAFRRSFTKLGGLQLFPRYGFRALPADHPLLSGEMFKAGRWSRKLTPAGLSNGVRELMLLVDGDLSRAWQINRLSGREEFQLGMDIVMYANRQRDWPQRTASPLITRDETIVQKRTIRVARLNVGDNPDPEPGGWDRLAILMHNQFATELKFENVAPTAKSLAGSNPPFQVASLTGTGALKLSDEARIEIAAFVNAGGTLIIDSAGGDAKFAASAQDELSIMFPPPPGQLAGTLLLPQDNVYHLKGAAIDHFHYRRFAAGKLPGRLNVPRLKGITIGNRVAVFFSPEDLANGLVGRDTDGVIGYDPDTATAIMRNLLLYAAGER